MKKIDIVSMETINGGVKCIYVGMGYTPTGGTMGQVFGTLGVVVGWGIDIYNCWNSN